jgi:hypothetical protein
MANELLPTIGSSGLWKVKAPFDTQLIASLSYTCKAVRKLAEFVATGADVFADHYEPNNIPQSVYQQHVNADISLVTLMSSTGNWLVVPTPYLDGWPSNDIVPYVILGMVVTLGAIPNTIDPGFLEPVVKNAIAASLGHVPEIQFVALSGVTNKVYSDHEALENLRKSNIKNDNSDYVRRLKAETDLVAARAQIAALQKFIIDSKVPIPTVAG